MINNERLKREVDYHDAIASRLLLSPDLAKAYLKYDSPASYIANRLPRLKEHLIKNIGEVQGKRVLVYGCGSDCAAIWFAKLGAYVDAIDISPVSVQNQQKLASMLCLKINSMVMDAHKLEIESGKYDLVYGNAILHHLDLETAIPEVHRVLKADGKAVFRDVMRGNVFLRFFRYLTPYWRTPDEHPLVTKDIELFKKVFSGCDITRYVFIGLPYFFFARIMNEVIFKKLKVNLKVPVNNSVYSFFDRLDKKLFSFISSMEKQAWLCLVVLDKKD